MDDDFAEKLMTIAGKCIDTPMPEINGDIDVMMADKRKKTNQEIKMRDKEFVNEESAKIEKWADDQTFSLEQELKDVKRQIKEKERDFRKEANDALRRQLQVDILTLQKAQRRKRQELFTLEDEIIDKRDRLIADIDSALNKQSTEEVLFTIAWQVI
jgi:predicted  nucleic acid-binding Zn-ribbon protein